MRRLSRHSGKVGFLVCIPPSRWHRTLYSLDETRLPCRHKIKNQGAEYSGDCVRQHTVNGPRSALISPHHYCVSLWNLIEKGGGLQDRRTSATSFFSVAYKVRCTDVASSLAF